MTDKFFFDQNALMDVLLREKEGVFDGDQSLKEVLSGVKRLVSERYGPFISGVGGENMDIEPEFIHVCYNYGVNYGGIYKLVHKGRTGP